MITKNNPKLFKKLDDVFPKPLSMSPDDIKPLDKTYLATLSPEFVEAVDTIASEDWSAFMFAYVTESKNKKLSSLTESLLEYNGLQMYIDYYSLTTNSIRMANNLLATKFKAKWIRLVDLFKRDYNALNPYTMKIEETTENVLDSDSSINRTANSSNTTETEDELLTDKNENSYYGFNSLSPTPTDESNRNSKSQGSATGTNESSSDTTTTYDSSRTIDRTVDREGNIGNTTKQELFNQEIESLRTQIWDIMFRDLDSIFCRNTYHSSIDCTLLEEFI